MICGTCGGATHLCNHPEETPGMIIIALPDTPAMREVLTELRKDINKEALDYARGFKRLDLVRAMKQLRRELRRELKREKES